MSSVLSVPAISAPTRVVRFGPAEFGALVALLEADRADSEYLPVCSAEDLAMAPDGRVGLHAPAGLRPSDVALAAVAGGLAKGLLALLRDLSGEDRKVGTEDDGAAGVAAAAQVYNAALRLRFESDAGPSGSQRLVEPGAGLLHAVLGRGYAPLANVEVLSLAEGRATELGLSFRGADVVGRSFSAVWAAGEPPLAAPGLRVASSEDGRCGVAVETGAALLPPGFAHWDGGSAAHRGNVRGRLSRLLDRATPPPAAAIVARLVAAGEPGITKSPPAALRRPMAIRTDADLLVAAGAAQLPDDFKLAAELREFCGELLFDGRFFAALPPDHPCAWVASA